MKHLKRFNENKSNKLNILSELLTDIFDRHEIKQYVRNYNRDTESRYLNDFNNDEIIIPNNVWEYSGHKNHKTGINILNITDIKATQITNDLRKLEPKLKEFNIPIIWSVEEGDEYLDESDLNTYYIIIKIHDL